MAPKEYTPELTADFLAGTLDQISDIYRQEEGRATAEAGARGLLGQTQGDMMVGQTRTARARGMSDAILNFNMGVAGLNREERLTREGREWEAGEAQKERDAREGLAVKLANMGYAYGDSSARRDYQYGMKGLVAGGIGNLVSRGAGAAMGKMF
jgi:hypothetical protein